TDITDRKRRETAKLREKEQAVKNYALALEAERSQRQRELSWLKEIVAKFSGVHAVEVHSGAMHHVFRQARQYHLDRSMPVLIQGETGTGKEVVAKVIHFSDMDTFTPFVDINCAALTATLFENELFGYDAGAFTGALIKGKSGKLDLAFGGTLFLDEVAEIPLELQGKLLRVIQEKEYYRVGGLKKIKTDVRIICATNVDLEEQVANGLFRKDLYYRLKVGHLVVPALRQRREDILPLATTFLREFSRQKSKNFQTIGQAAGRLLLDYHWPGNVRELRNVMEWVVFMYNDRVLQPEHLELLEKTGPAGTVKPKQNLLDPGNFTLPSGEFPLEDFLDRLVRQALAMHRGNKAETARYLDISRSSLYCRLRRGED
ncbi:MAG: sigma-54 dependent transcriptional regulator, partial [Heliobacteriaceae bacterium]|nr:sigma-54 dependent transcriptional regulator [Heliobacteriaceae bacterium]